MNSTRESEPSWTDFHKEPPQLLPPPGLLMPHTQETLALLMEQPLSEATRTLGKTTPTEIITSVMQGMVWGEPELVQVYDFDVDHVRCTRCKS